MAYFERLVTSVERVAHHPYFPGKRQTVELCLEDIEGLSLDGLITVQQQDLLREILLSTSSLAA